MFSLKKIDKEGKLHYVEISGSCNNLLARLASFLIGKFGCSAFVSEDEIGNVITGRNYDFPHEKHGKPVVNNIVVKFSPKKGYKSLCVADFAMLGSSVPKSLLVFLPCLCMDGINEKGLCISILVVERREKQIIKNKEPLIPTELLRRILLNCSTVQEAFDYAQNYVVKHLKKKDYHFFVTDAFGHSGLLEYNGETLELIDTNIATNFYQNKDDAKDCYLNGKLKERFVQPKEYSRKYVYGAGYGYERFSKIASFLETKLVCTKPYKTKISEKQAFETLKSVSQTLDDSGISSNTAYSLVYNNTEKSLALCVDRKYDKTYRFLLD